MDLTKLPATLLDERQRYTIDEAALLLRVSRSRLYEKVRAKEIGTIADGGRRFVPGAEIARLSRLV